MAQDAQSLKNHVRFDPAFHFFLAPVSLIMLVTSIINVIRNPGWASGFTVLAAIWGTVAIFLIRIYALKVQDRVIRLEERLRLRELLPASQHGAIGKLTEDQLIGLRFASDGEVAVLVEKTVAGNWNRKQVKAAIQVWRPDTWRV